jgi:hypothetical protein
MGLLGIRFLLAVEQVQQEQLALKEQQVFKV